MQYHELASNGSRLTCAPFPSGLSQACFLIYGTASVLPRQLKVPSSSMEKCQYFHPMCCQDTNNRHSSGTRHSVLQPCVQGHISCWDWAAPRTQPAWGKWHLWAIIAQDEQNKIVKNNPSCLVKLDCTFTVMSKGSISGTPSYSSKFIAFLQRVQDHLINCSLCTAGTVSCASELELELGKVRQY